MVSEDSCLLEVRELRAKLMEARDLNSTRDEMFRFLDDWSVQKLIECADRRRRESVSVGNGD